jgi:hypothetical protein
MEFTRFSKDSAAAIYIHKGKSSGFFLNSMQCLLFCTFDDEVEGDPEFSLRKSFFFVPS